MAPALPTDPALPQLAQALDAPAMGAVFAGVLADQRAGATLVQCSVDRVKYRPQRNCSISYRLQLRDASGRPFEQLISARVCSSGDALRRHQQALARGPQPSAAGPSVSHLAALDMVAFWLPNDAKLDATALLLNDDAMRRSVLPEVLAALGAGAGSLVDHRTTLVQLVPELRVCARVDLQWRTSTGTSTGTAPGSALRTATVYAKTDLERSAAATLAVMQALYASPARVHGRLHMAQPLLWQAQGDLYWQAAVAGQALPDRHGDLAPNTAAAVGAQLAALHATPVPGVPALGVALLTQQAHDSSALLARVAPAWQARLCPLVAWLQAGAAALAALPPITLHGDLHLNNLLIDGPRLALIDFDSVCRGPAVIELGGWIADMLGRCALQGCEPGRAAASCHAFLAGYARAANQPLVATPLLAWSVVHALLCKRAHRCVSTLKPGRLAAVPVLLDMAEAIAQHGSLDAVLGAPASQALQAA